MSHTRHTKASPRARKMLVHFPVFDAGCMLMKPFYYIKKRPQVFIRFEVILLKFEHRLS